MKNIFMMILASSTFCHAQEKNIDSLKVSDLEVPNSPALTLLDKSFSLIEVSNSSNSINANLVNIKDNSVEIVPFWLLNTNKHTTSNAYYGFTREGDRITKQNIFNDFIKKGSISLAYTTTDTLSSISFGLRSNIISYKSLKKINDVFANQTEYNRSRNEYTGGKKKDSLLTKLVAAKIESEPKIKIIVDAFKQNDDIAGYTNYVNGLRRELDPQARDILTDVYDSINKSTFDKLAKDFNKYFNHKVFSWDVALGSSVNFPDNQSDTGRLGRYGVWSTAKYSQFIGDDDFFNLYSYGRFLIDETEIDATTLDYIKNEYLDFGGKLEYQFKKVSISAEYINRIGDDKDYKLVGIIQYKIQDNLFLSGGYGKNFDSDSGNLLTLFGLKWGLSEKASVKFD